MRMLASEIQTGDTVTYCGATFRARAVHRDPVSGLVKVAATGGLPQYIAPEREVQVHRPAPPDPKPYKVLTRYYRPSGFCEKRRHEFATKKAQQSFMDRTKRVVTFHTI